MNQLIGAHNLSLVLILILTLGFVILFSQFGNRLAARNSASWWMVAAFIYFAAIYPEGLQPLAEFLGIQLVSNLVLASMIGFLLIQTLELTYLNTRLSRGHRLLISNLTKENYCNNRPADAAEDRPKVLIVLPCYNEADNLPKLIPALDRLKQATEHLAIDYCFVNDGSTDQSVDILRELAPSQFASHLANVGVAGVLMSGFKIAAARQCDFVVQCDADGQHPIEGIVPLVEKAMQAKADLMIGSRFVTETTAAHDALRSTTLLRRMGGKLVALSLRAFGQSARVSDPTSGFRVYSKQAVADLLSLMPDEYPEPESIAILSIKRRAILETFVEMEPRTAGTSSLSGLRSAQYMLKVFTALIGLRFRSLVGRT